MFAASAPHATQSYPNQTSVCWASHVSVKQWWLVSIRLSSPTRNAVHSTVPSMSRRATGSACSTTSGYEDR
nr:hypothetical protein GCM10025732_13580 [Glycomyces mayteni]